MVKSLLLEAWAKLRWDRSPGRAEALFRIGFGAVLLVQLVTLQPNVVYFYSTEAVWAPLSSLAPYYTPGLVELAFWVWCASALLLLFGAFTRPAAAVCFVCCVYFLLLRTPKATHAADWLIPALAFQLLLLPSNRRFALDARLRPALTRASVPAWPARLAQLGLGFFYFTAGTSKLGDPMWGSGKGFYMTFANPLLSHYDLTWLATSPASPIIDYFVIAWECAMPVLLLWQRTRLVAVLSATLFLLAIDLSLPVGWFSWFCLASLLIMVDSIAWPRAWLRRWPWLEPAVEGEGESEHENERNRIQGRRGGVLAWGTTAFVVFHLASFALIQTAYLLVATHRFEAAARLTAVPLLAPYALYVANVRYYALWPSFLFYPVRFGYFEASAADGASFSLSAIDDQGRARLGWLQAREVRGDVLAIEAVRGMTLDSWRRLLQHLAAQAWSERGLCPSEIRAYELSIGPGSFDTDLRQGKRLLQRAGFACSPAPELRFVLGR